MPRQKIEPTGPLSMSRSRVRIILVPGTLAGAQGDLLRRVEGRFVLQRTGLRFLGIECTVAQPPTPRCTGSNSE